MKKLKIFILTILFLQTSIFAQNSFFKTDIKGSVGLRNALLNEFVYANNSVSGEQYYLSLLNWNLENSIYVGLNADLCFKKFHLAVDLKEFLPSTFGFMDDSDWLQDYYYKTGNSSIKTNYSTHSIKFTQGFNAGLDLFYEITPITGLQINPKIGASYELYEIYGIDGTAYYGNSSNGGSNSYYAYNNSSHNTVSNFSGNIIKLKQEYIFTWIGFSIKYQTPSQKLLFDISADISPWLYVISLDSHLKRSPIVYYLDKGYAVFGAARATVAATYTLSDFLKFRFGITGLFTKEIECDDYISQESETGKYYNSGGKTGSAIRYFDLQFSVSFNF